jgi:hypothetical protein
MHRTKFSRLYENLALWAAEKCKAQRQHDSQEHAVCTQQDKIIFLCYVKVNICFEKTLNT